MGMRVKLLTFWGSAFETQPQSNAFAVRGLKKCFKYGEYGKTSANKHITKSRDANLYQRHLELLRLHGEFNFL